MCVCVCVCVCVCCGVSGASTCCAEKSVLLIVPSHAPGALLAWLTVPAEDRRGEVSL